METCVLIPQELILGPSSSNEAVLAVRTSQRLERSSRLLPFQGTVRTDKIELIDKIDDEDVSDFLLALSGQPISEGRGEFGLEQTVPGSLPEDRLDIIYR